MKLTPEQIEKLNKKLPDWAVKPNEFKKNMSTIHPMAVIDRLNEVFGVGGWNFFTKEISCTEEIQNTKNGDRKVYMSSVHGQLFIDNKGDVLRLEQFGGSTNDDKGDSLKGGATDALTKIASYLGIGAEIYKGHGNVEPKVEKTLFEIVEEAIENAKDLKTVDTLTNKVHESTKLNENEKADLITQLTIKSQELI